MIELFHYVQVDHTTRIDRIGVGIEEPRGRERLDRRVLVLYARLVHVAVVLARSNHVVSEHGRLVVVRRYENEIVDE